MTVALFSNAMRIPQDSVSKINGKKLKTYLFSENISKKAFYRR